MKWWLRFISLFIVVVACVVLSYLEMYDFFGPLFVAIGAAMGGFYSGFIWGDTSEK
jgi:hypothetical protein